MTKRRQIIVLSFSLLIILSMVMIYYYDDLAWNTRARYAMDTIRNLVTTDHENMYITALQNDSRRSNMKVILFYTPFFGHLPWPHAIGREKRLTDFYSNRLCKVATCRLSIDKTDIWKSSAVLFHGYSLPRVSKMRAMQSWKPKGQLWAWFNEESQAQYINTDFTKLSNMFELTITHMRESDVHSSYGYYFKLNDRDRVQAENTYANKTFTEGKDRLVLWFASNCVSLRLNIVKAIAKHVHVDVFGRCQKHFPQQKGNCSRRTGECFKVNQRYKFYLSIENTNCRGYLTEKYWENALDRDVVPIVIAGSYNKDVLIPGSYIDILDFPNASSLASHLKYLDNNDTAYNQYFRWKTNYSYSRKTNWLCDLCEYLHRNETKQSYWDMKTFFGAEENCFADDSRLENSWIKS